MPVTWTAEKYQKLLSAVIAAHPEFKFNYREIAIYFGENTTYDAIEGCFRPLKKKAQVLRDEVDTGVRPKAPAGPSHRKRVKRTRAESEMSEYSMAGSVPPRSASIMDDEVKGKISRGESVREVTPPPLPPPPSSSKRSRISISATPSARGKSESVATTGTGRTPTKSEAGTIECATPKRNPIKASNGSRSRKPEHEVVVIDDDDDDDDKGEGENEADIFLRNKSNNNSGGEIKYRTNSITSTPTKNSSFINNKTFTPAVSARTSNTTLNSAKTTGSGKSSSSSTANTSFSSTISSGSSYSGRGGGTMNSFQRRVVKHEIPSDDDESDGGLYDT